MISLTRQPAHVIDVFVDALDLAEMSFEGVEPAAMSGDGPPTASDVPKGSFMQRTGP